MIQFDTLDFDLPSERIAQEPLKERDAARLMVFHRQTNQISHCLFKDIETFLEPTDDLVINKAKVNRAKFVGRKKTGGRVEVIVVSPTSDPSLWRALVRPLLPIGTAFTLGAGLNVVLVERTAIGENIIRCDGGDPAILMNSEGKIPLPPYIKRSAVDPRDVTDAEDYQTVYASEPGSLAAPTAGLHFTPALLDKIRQKGVRVHEILLHVGWGTFRPIAKRLDDHEMLPERYEVSRETYDALQAARRRHRRIISVGTTSTRVLESLSINESEVQLKGETNLFIKPGRSFQWLSGLVTNFHVPRSTPLALTAAFAGPDNLSRCYEEAIRSNYRFFSYGDAMLIL